MDKFDIATNLDVLLTYKTPTEARLCYMLSSGVLHFHLQIAGVTEFYAVKFITGTSNGIVLYLHPIGELAFTIYDNEGVILFTGTNTMAGLSGLLLNNH